MKIAYFGSRGSYTHQAALKEFPEENLSSETFAFDICDKVMQGRIDCGILPLENRIEGIVTETIDALMATGAKACREIVLPIRHCLGVLPGTNGVEEIVSHEQAIKQCLPWIREVYGQVKLTTMSSTSRAAEEVNRLGHKGVGVLASQDTLTNYGFEILDKDIRKGNMTRFIVVSTVYSPRFLADMRTLLGVELEKDETGALCRQILTPLYENDTNVFQINSRPNGLDGYKFPMEVAGHPEDKRLANALKKINSITKNLSPTVTILGSYESHGWTV